MEKLLGCRVHVVEPEAQHWAIRERIIEEAVPLWKTTGFTWSTSLSI
jgi:hypothetical protein